MNTKINEISSFRHEKSANSDLYTRYRAAFEKLLALPVNGGEKDIYIADHEFDEEVKSVYQDDWDSISIVAGYEGIGKSTSLRHIFHFHNDAPVIVHDVPGVLVFPATFNGYVPGGNIESADNGFTAETIRNELCQRINSVCSFLEKQFPALCERFSSERGQHEFHRYLSLTNPKVLQRLSYEESITLTGQNRERRELALAFQEEPFIYAASKLKYYMGCAECGCRKLIVIVDDIEPLPYSNQLEIAMQYGRFFSCMNNRSEEVADLPYVINLILSMRPHTYRYLSVHDAFRAFPVTRIIFKRNMVDFPELLSRKVDIYSPEIPHKNEKAWKDACNILQILSTKFSRRYSTLIKNLALWNTRETISLYKQVLMNRNWVQRNMDRSAAFSISEENYVFNNITVIRAIACGFSYVYFAGRDNPVPDILLNTRSGKNYSFISISLLKLFNMADRPDFYGEKAWKKETLKQKFADVFPGLPDFREDMEYIIQYMYQVRLIDRSINDTTCVESADLCEELKDSSLVHLSPRGYEIWNMIASDSVYLELCREAYYRNYDSGICSASSFELMRSGNQADVFIELFHLLQEILLDEESYIQSAENSGTLDMYRSVFGDDSVVTRFLIGICKSIDYSGLSSHKEILEARKRLEEDMNRVSHRLQGFRRET